MLFGDEIITSYNGLFNTMNSTIQLQSAQNSKLISSEEQAGLFGRGTQYQRFHEPFDKSSLNRSTRLLSIPTAIAFCVSFPSLPVLPFAALTPSFITMTDTTAVAKFMDITGADTTTATFFLSAAQGNVDAAVSTFFESGGMIPAGMNVGGPSTRPTPRRPTPASSSAPIRTPSRPQRPPRTTGFATLDSLRGEDEDKDEEANNYYAGGEKSGQMVQGPRGRGNGGEDEETPTDLAEAIFERARQRGPRTDEERSQFGESQTFTGAGYRLGNTGEPRPDVPDVMVRRNVTRELTFYANGFTVDDGPLRRFDDPENEAFLSDVNRGVVPREMEEAGVGDVSITLIDKKNEEYVPPKKRVVPFSGGGQRLGTPSTTPATGGEVNPERAAAAVTVDESRPVASVQIRLSDGTRLIARLNEDSTVGDLRAFVAASRPGNAQFTLSTTFPKKVLDDDSKTIKEAQLKGAVVLQTLQ